jgi:L-asparagine transporter-like permease
MPGGIRGIAGSMLVVIFSYAGFEIIGLAASEAENPSKTIPRAIAYTVIGLVGLFILYIAVLLPLIPTAVLSEQVSPMVAALSRWGMGWAGQAINFILITAILSTMMAAMFGLGRMIRSLAEEGHAPRQLKDKTDVPYRGIIFSGISMLVGLGAGLFFPRIYLFLISAGGFASLLTYAAILATHIRFRRCHGCPPEGKCQMPGYPITSWIALIGTIGVIVSMPFIAGQSSGLIAGIAMTVLYAVIYLVMRLMGREKEAPGMERLHRRGLNAGFSNEMSEEFTGQEKKGKSIDMGSCSEKGKAKKKKETSDTDEFEDFYD